MRHHRKHPRYSELQVEALERRLNLAGNVVVALSGSTLSVTGDDSANSVEIVQTGAAQLTVSGFKTGPGQVQTNLSFKGIAATETGPGTNIFTINLAGPISLKANMKGGADELTLGDSGGAFVSSVTSLSVDMGAGMDELNIEKAAVTGSGATSISLGGDNDYDYFSAVDVTAANSAVTIKSGNGYGYVNIDNSSNLAASFKSLTINGGNHGDSVYLSGVNVTTATTISTGSDYDYVSTNNLTTGTLKAQLGSGDDTFYGYGLTVNATTGTTLIDLSSGNDRAYFSTGLANPLIKNSLTISGGAGENDTSVYNTTVQGALTVTGSNEYDELNVGSSTISGSLTANLGAGDNEVNLNSTNVAANIAVTTGKGDDNVYMDTTTAAAVSLKLGAGENYVELTDVYKAGLTQLTSLLIETGAGFDVLKLDGVLSAKTDVKVGDGDNTVNVTGSTLGNLTFVSGKGVDNLVVDALIAAITDIKLGAGNDVVNASNSTFTTSLKVDGGAGTDTLTDGGGNTGAGFTGIVTVSIP